MKIIVLALLVLSIVGLCFANVMNCKMACKNNNRCFSSCMESGEGGVPIREHHTSPHLQLQRHAFLQDEAPAVRKMLNKRPTSSELKCRVKCGKNKSCRKQCKTAETTSSADLAPRSLQCEMTCKGNTRCLNSCFTSVQLADSVLDECQIKCRGKTACLKKCYNGDEEAESDYAVFGKMPQNCPFHCKKSDYTCDLACVYGNFFR